MPGRYSRAKAMMDLISICFINLIYIMFNLINICLGMYNVKHSFLLAKSDGGASGCFEACGFKKMCNSCPFFV